MTTDAWHLHPVGDSRAWARVFAAVYDPFLWIGERAGMRRHRHDLVTLARGRTLEIGSGTGLNLLHYPDDLDACGFRLDAHPATWRAMPPIIRPLVVWSRKMAPDQPLQTPAAR